jgi:membrane associated rhomboid family serine protease
MSGRQPLDDLLLLEVLRACAQTAPQPLQSAAFASDSGLDRAVLDQALDELRLLGLVRLTEWTPDGGQGYAVSAEGEMVLRNPDLIRATRRGNMEAAATSPDVEAERQKLPEQADSTPIPRTAVVCRLLLALNVLFFAIGLHLAVRDGVRLEDYVGGSVANPAVASIQNDLGAVNPAQVAENQEWWRLVSYAFVPRGLLDLLVSMYLLFSVGRQVEGAFGRLRFLFLFLCGALGGGCAALVALTPTAGAMAAVAAVIACRLVWGVVRGGVLPPGSTGMSNVFTIVLILVVGSFVPGISWQALAGGAVSGALLAFPLYFGRFGSGWTRGIGLASMAVMPALALALVMHQQASLPEAAKVRRDLFPPYRDAEEAAASVFNTDAVPLLDDWAQGKDVDRERLATLRSNLDDSRRRLDEALRQLDKAGPFEDKRVKNTVRQARGYLEEWSKFYALFSKAIEPAPPWPAESYHALAGQLEAIKRARRPLANSSLLPSAYSAQ